MPKINPKTAEVNTSDFGKYFVHDPLYSGCETFNTEKQAIKCAQEYYSQRKEPVVVSVRLGVYGDLPRQGTLYFTKVEVSKFLS